MLLSLKKVGHSTKCDNTIESWVPTMSYEDTCDEKDRFFYVTIPFIGGI